MIQAQYVPPVSNRDFDFFYEGLRSHKLLIQQCDACGRLRNPPAPMCPYCQSLGWTPNEVSGRGTVYSFTIHHRPPLPYFAVPHPIVLVDLAEGVRMVGAYHAPDFDQLAIGDRVMLQFLDLDCGDVLPYFVPEIQPAAES